ncbi:hypothetical protein TNCV_287611 [Trichonephila clavipes]|nr:hypothetical protein TNCV_287611 [Trichonephila clavipes]
MSVFSAASDKGTLIPTTTLCITVLKPLIPYSANSQSDLERREQQYCGTINRNSGTLNSTFIEVRKVLVSISTSYTWHHNISPGSNVQMQFGTATAGSDVVQFGCPIFDDFFQHLWPYIGNNTVNVVFQMVKRLWFIRIDQ